LQSKTKIAAITALRLEAARLVVTNATSTCEKIVRGKSDTAFRLRQDTLQRLIES